MKNIALIFASMFLLSTAALAGEGKVNMRSHKKTANNKAQLSDKLSSMLDYPSYILDGTNETVMIAYSIDENDVMHVQDIISPNSELKEYIFKRLDGKKMKNVEGKNGVVKVQFNATTNQRLFIQF